ncbi:MAG: MFS transporter [Caldilineaceae bacterium]|nr:MFS transporter [Caldilineaceae bacterium]
MQFRPIVSRLPTLLAENPAFRRFWLALLVSSTGDRFGSIAMNLYVLKLTGSGGALAGMLAIQSLPSLFIAPLAGVWIDRLSRRRVLLVGNFASALIYGLLPFTQELWHLYLLALLARCAATFLLPAQRALIPDLVESREVVLANATISAGQQIVLLVSASLAGLLVAFAGAGVAFAFNASTFLAANGLLLGIRGELPRSTANSRSIRQFLWELGDGFSFGLRHPGLRIVLIATFCAAIAGAMLGTMEVILISETLGGGEAGYGYMLSLVGLGAIAASLAAPRLDRRYSLPGLYVAGIVGSGLGFFVYANAGNLWLAILAGGLHAVPWFLRQIVIDSIVQKWAPPLLRGRIFAILQMERPLGLLLFTGLFSAYIDQLGPVVLINLAGVIYTAVGLWVLSRMSTLRRMDAAESEKA